MTIALNVPAETNAIAARALQIIESMPTFAWSADSSGRFTYVSPSALAYLGAPHEDLNPSPGGDEFGWRQVVHPDDYERVAARWRRCLQTGENYDGEQRLRRADGVYRWFRNLGRPSRDSQGRIAEWYGTAIDIDEQKQAEAALRARERELSQLVDMVPSHLWRLAQDGEPIFFNTRMVDFIGLDVVDTDNPGVSRLEMIIENTIHPDDAAAFREVLSNCLATGESFVLRYRLRRADGVYRWMSSRAEPMRDEGGRIIQWYGLCHDIDDQVHAEEALRRSERQLQQLIDTVPAVIWCTTPEGTPCYLNKWATDVTGLTVKDLIASDGSRSLTVVHPDDRETFDQALARSFKTGTSFEGRYRQRRADGSYRWAESRAEPLRDDSGNIVQWYGATVDVHDLVTAQEALRDRERELSLLVDMIPSHLWRVAPGGETTLVNRHMVEFFGDDWKMKWDTAIDTIVHPDDLKQVLEEFGRCLRTGDHFSMQYRLRRVDGVYRWMSGRAEPMLGENGQILQWFGLCHDIDDQVHAEEALRRASDKLARAAQAASLAELSASIAHEVTQPLAAIVTNSEACHNWLSAEPPNLERAKITAARITRDANSAADVVSRIRALFRQVPQSRSPDDINLMITEVCRLMADEIATKGINIETNLEQELPSVAIDRVQIQQVLVNLIRNGIEAMDAVIDGGRPLQIRTCRDGVDAIRVEVRDAGTGFEDSDRVFEPFCTTKQQGMGMGLAICRSIVEAHGGRLWTVNNETRGATVAFTLALVARDAP
jgi:PAS domain S-box-containing protein